jgi:hypothetical protein
VRPIDGDAPPHRAAEEIVYGHAERLALDIEQRVLDGCDSLPVDAAAGLHSHGPEMAVDQLDVARILADHHRRQRFDDLREAAAAEALVVFRPADEPFVGRDLEKREQPPAGVAAQGFDTFDFHGWLVPRFSLLVGHQPSRLTHDP